jgi:coniferyl-aldehyde dehydrogenase
MVADPNDTGDTVVHRGSRPRGFRTTDRQSDASGEIGPLNLEDNVSSLTGVGTTALSAPEGLSAILERQREAFLRDGPPSLKQRRTDLAKLEQAVKASATRIADVISEDFGNRSRYESLLAEVLTVCTSIRHASRYLPRWMSPRRVSVNIELRPGRALIMHQPIGVVGIISPWNYPFLLAIMPLVAALAAGNRVMLKPSERTPQTAQFIAELLADLFPPEQVTTVLGDREVGAGFSRLPFDHLFYTGSAIVGRQVMKAAAENLTPVTLELGGKSPCILGADARLRSAAESIFYGKLINAGQSCIAPDYVLLPVAMLEEFIRAAADAVNRMYPTISSNPDYTSIIDDHHYRRILGYLEEAKARGVRVIEPGRAGEPLGQNERKVLPTLVIEPGDELTLMREEIFGPVLPIKTYSRIDEAIDYVNGHPRPLALYYFGANEEERKKVLERTISGGVSVNETLLHALVEELPFGGIGASGMGAYHGESGFRTFSHQKGVFQQSRFSLSWTLRPPFTRVKDGLIRLLLMR